MMCGTCSSEDVAMHREHCYGLGSQARCQETAFELQVLVQRFLKLRQQ